MLKLRDHWNTEMFHFVLLSEGLIYPLEFWLEVLDLKMSSNESEKLSVYWKYKQNQKNFIYQADKYLYLRK